MRARRLAGWSVGMNKWLDETGTFHLMAVGDDGIVYPVCGSRAAYFGSAAHDQPPYGHACRTCVKAQPRDRQAPPGGGSQPQRRRGCQT